MRKLIDPNRRIDLVSWNDDGTFERLPVIALRYDDN